MNNFFDITRDNGFEADIVAQQYGTLQRNHVGDTQSVVVSTDHSGLKLDWRDGLPLQGAVKHPSVFDLWVKRKLDVLASVIALLVLFPLLVLVTLAVKATSAGPVFFRQQREGLHGTTFYVFKFRTMKLAEGDPSGIVQTTANDVRLTKIGGFLRRTSIDELPQLINVLRGEMSLVGPRPHVPGMLAGGVRYDELVPYYHQRYAMRPGITGWAQANGYRGETRSAAVALARIDHDMAYIHNFSLLLDANILIRTLLREFLTGSGH